MEKKQPKDERDEKISKLESQLEHTYQLIEQMRRDKNELQQQIIRLQNIQIQESKSVSNSQLSQPKLSRKQSYFQTIENRFQKLSKWQFILIVSAVAGGLAITGFLITKIFAQHPLEKSAKVLPKTVNSIPVSPGFPIGQNPQTSAQFSSPVSSVNPGNTDNINNNTQNHLPSSPKLQSIVNKIVKMASDKGLPTKPLSITLIDLTQNNSAGFAENTLRYPASVVKMFWLVILYDHIQKGILSETDFQPYINKMMLKSDNNAASTIVDAITQTESGNKLDGDKYQTWLNNRNKLNLFFQQDGYQDINITQKTFPIPELNIKEPQGRDLQIRGDNPEKNPIRNKMTTIHAASLLYKIYTEQAVSPEASQKMAALLTRNVDRNFWKQQPPNPIEFNPVESFFGESVPTNTRFLSKAGWTLNCRNEVALIHSKDNKTIYILAVFADDPAYAKDKRIFPEISSLVYKNMTK